MAAPANLTSKWSQAYHAANLRIATESVNVFAEWKVRRAHGATNEQRSVEHPPEIHQPRARRAVPALLREVRRRVQRRGIQPRRQHHSGSLLLSRSPRRRVQRVPRQLEAWRDNAATANPGRLNAYVYHPGSARHLGRPVFRPASCCRVLRVSLQLRPGVRARVRKSRRCSGAGTATRSW